MTATPVRPVAIKIDEDIKARLKRLADARQRTSHWLMQSKRRCTSVRAARSCWMGIMFVMVFAPIWVFR